LYAVPLSLLGFAIPTLLLIPIKVFQGDYEWALTWLHISRPGFGCALMFALAAVLHLSPKKQLRIGYMTALIYSGGCLIVAIMISVSLLFGIGLFPTEQRAYTPNLWRSELIFWSVTTIFACLLISLFVLSLKPTK
jgi:hypothetical protein